jgi:hypothetical protein
MNGRMSFATYVAATRNDAVDALMTKAMFANRLANIVTDPGQRRQLYKSKSDCISRAMEVGPERVIVDSIDMRHGVLGIEGVGNRIRLHARAPLLSRRAQAVAHEQIARCLGLAAA